MKSMILERALESEMQARREEAMITTDRRTELVMTLKSDKKKKDKFNKR